MPNCKMGIILEAMERFAFAEIISVIINYCQYESTDEDKHNSSPSMIKRLPRNKTHTAEW